MLQNQTALVYHAKYVMYREMIFFHEKKHFLIFYGYIRKGICLDLNEMLLQMAFVAAKVKSYEFMFS